MPVLSKQEAQRLYQSPEYHATTNTASQVLYAVEKFMFVITICQTVSAFSTYIQYIHIWNWRKRFLESFGSFCPAPRIEKYYNLCPSVFHTVSNLN
jgi:hypothetical protein